MFIIKYLDRNGEVDFTTSAPLSATDVIVEQIAGALKRLATLPAGCKLEITYEPEVEK